MLDTPENWPLTSYTNDTWTPVVTGLAVVASIVIANTDAGGPITVAVRVGTTILVPDTAIDPGTTHTVDVRSVNVKAGQTLDLRASLPGINVLASGAVESP